MFRIVSLIAALCLGTGPAAYANGHDATGYQIYVHNNCPRDMRLAIRHLAPGADWKSLSWWTLRANAGTYLSSSGVRLLHQANLRQLYMYAETPDGRGHFHTGREYEDYNLIEIKEFRYVVGRSVNGTINNDTFEVTLKCDDYL